MEFLSLLLQYKKPKEILTLEKELLGELKKLKGTNEGDIDCKTQWTAIDPEPLRSSRSWVIESHIGMFLSALCVQATGFQCAFLFFLSM